MQIKTLTHSFQGYSRSLILFNTTPPLSRFRSSFSPPSLRFFTSKTIRRGVKTSCVSPGQELVYGETGVDSFSLPESEEEREDEEGEEIETEVTREGLESQNIWNQMKEIVMFTGPATGLWICGPLMSLIDTAVIGQGSSIELAALGISSFQKFCSVFLFKSFVWVFTELM